MKKLTYLTVALLLVLSCGGGTQYKDASKDEGSAEWGPKEIKSTAGKMTKSLHKYLKTEWKRPAILQVKKIRNNTTEHIQTTMLSDEIVNNLIRQRIRFIDETLSADAVKEMEKGMTGVVDPDSAVPVGALLSPNIYLFGEISDNVRHVKGDRVQYLVVTLKLTELSTGMLLWQDKKEFLKATKDKKYGW